MDMLSEPSTITAAAAHQRTYGGNNAFHNFGVFCWCRYNHGVDLVAQTDMAQRTTTPTYKIPICGGDSPCPRSTRRLLVHTVGFSHFVIIQRNVCDKLWYSSELLCNLDTFLLDTLLWDILLWDTFLWDAFL